MPKPNYMLSPRETFEKYERRSPTFAAADPYRQHSPIELQMPADQRSGQFVVTEFAPPKRKVSYPLIIGLAIAIPVFVMVILFLAIWLQELGWI